MRMIAGRPPTLEAHPNTVSDKVNPLILEFFFFFFSQDTFHTQLYQIPTWSGFFARLVAPVSGGLGRRRAVFPHVLAQITARPLQYNSRFPSNSDTAGIEACQ